MPSFLDGRTIGRDRRIKGKIRWHLLRSADLKTALSTLRESLLAHVSRIIAASRAGSSQDAPRRGFLAPTLKSRRKGNARRHRSPSPTSSSTSSSPSLATTDGDEDRTEAKASNGKQMVLKGPEDRFAHVVDYRSCRLRNRHSTYVVSHARNMGRMAKTTRFSFGGTPIFHGKEPVKAFSRL